ncbi:MAG: hypothetical protein HKO62_03040 [Gammaproteobacteria bacterium]|nr:hypothetical protein [Gammaproteobacteria bacterium]
MKTGLLHMLPFRYQGPSLLGALLSLALLLSAPGAQARIKCWTNDEGVRECGNVVPPEYAQQRVEEKNAAGITVGEEEEAKTLEDLAEERRLAAEAAEAERARRAQQAEDRVLLDTFTSVDDLEMARDGQIANIDGQIKITESHISKLRVSLDQQISKAAAMERRGNEPGEGITANIDRLRSQIIENEAFIDAKREEQDRIRSQYAIDIDRYKALKGVN